MKEIEEAWFGKQSNCPDSSTTVSSNSLSLRKASIWSRIVHLFRIFDRKDLNSHIFNKSALNEACTDAPGPSIYSVRTICPEGHGTPSAEYVDSNPNEQPT
ncbi:hypothetical protein RCOM_0919790 [Ricinus communis]|uniref:Uncharacterized protein n=1 Tax=Ricinus communis TaxID=3988 RepID=B9RNQ6_RICCO|nr:hypothetical protein RCOM_0919790 [Ricinus communis]